MKKNVLIKRSFLSFVAAVSASAILASCAPKSATPDSTPAGGPSIERGKYLVSAIGCNDCHTPLKMGANGPEPDMSRMLSGHPSQILIGGPTPLQPPWGWSGTLSMTAYGGPWGVSFAANLTPDSATGMGAWNMATFDSAIRTGKHMGSGRPILPPMPWQSLRNLTDDDLGSIYQYLHSIPAISNKVPDPIMPSSTPPPAMGGPMQPPPMNFPPGQEPRVMPPPPPPPPPIKKK
jgi:cytochrome c